MDKDQLLQEYLQQLKSSISVVKPNAYTDARVALIKEYIERPSHEQYWLIQFERHWKQENDNN